MRICVAGTLDLAFHRNRILMRLLDHLDWTVDLKNVQLWGERGDVLVRRGKLRLAVRAAWAIPLATWRFLWAPKPDVLLVGYPGHLDMPWLALVAKLRGVPVVFDTFISLFDTVVLDRRLIPETSLIARLLGSIDALACRLADIVLVDTPAHAEFLAGFIGSATTQFRVLWIGAEECLFHPIPTKVEPRSVLFYGTYIPLHGIETIVRAARLLEQEGVEIRLIGRGQLRGRIEALIDELGVTNVDLIEPVSLSALPSRIARSSICLGIFGTTSKALRVIPNKVFQAVAMARPVVTGDTPAIRAAFNSREIAMVPPGDPEALASAIRRLLTDPTAANRLARAGHKKFVRQYSELALSNLLRKYLEEAAARAGDRNPHGLN